MTPQALLVVKLDDPNYPGDGGEVIGHLLYPSEIRRYHDRDGCKAKDIRIWQGNAKVGQRVHL